MRTEAGFTLTELMVVMFVASLTVGIGFSAYFSSRKLFGEWDRKARTIRLVDGAVQKIAADMRKSKTVTLVSDSLAFLGLIDGKEIAYRFSGGNITRNSVPFNPDPSVAINAGIYPTSYGYNVVVNAVSRIQTASAQADVRQLESSALSLRESLSDAGTN